MSDIKSLADEIREKIRLQDAKNSVTPEKVKEKSPEKPKKHPFLKATDKEISNLFNALEAYELCGSDKMLIRLDTRTTNLLKQLKLAKGIDMNKFIAYSLQNFLEQHSWLSSYIKETLKNTDL